MDVLIQKTRATNKVEAVKTNMIYDFAICLHKFCRRSGWEIWQKVLMARIVAVPTFALRSKHIDTIPTLFRPVTKLIYENSKNIRSVIISMEKQMD
jgi:hypothetical protein